MKVTNEMKYYSFIQELARVCADLDDVIADLVEIEKFIPKTQRNRLSKILHALRNEVYAMSEKHPLEFEEEE